MEKSNEPIVLDGTDESLLVSIRPAGGQKGATLTEIIAVGNMINRSIFNPPELRAGRIPGSRIASGIIRFMTP